MYAQDKIKDALKEYHQCSSVTSPIRVLGYPTRRTLDTWIVNEGAVKPGRKPLKHINIAEHPRHPPAEIKLEAIHPCFEPGERIQSVLEAIGSTRTSLYSWQNKDLLGGADILANDKNIEPNALTKGSAASAPELVQVQTQSGIGRWRETSYRRASMS